MIQDKILVVTSPDDVLTDGIRILAYDLHKDQMQMLSDAVSNINDTLIIYIAKSEDEYQWVLDKKLKSSIIILNAESTNQAMVGYLAAQKNSVHFGTLRSLPNTNQITDLDSVINFIGGKSRDE